MVLLLSIQDFLFALDQPTKINIRSTKSPIKIVNCKCLILLEGDEADELRDTFLHELLCLLFDLSVGGNGPSHDACDVGDWEELRRSDAAFD